MAMPNKTAAPTASPIETTRKFFSETPGGQTRRGSGVTGRSALHTPALPAYPWYQATGGDVVGEAGLERRRGVLPDRGTPGI